MAEAGPTAGLLRTVRSIRQPMGRLGGVLVQTSDVKNEITQRALLPNLLTPFFPSSFC